MTNKFLKEIFEQPEAIESALNFYTSSEGEDLLKRVKKIIKNNKIEQIIFTGMGSSYFISYAAVNLFNDLKIHSFVINASELLHYNSSLLNSNTLLICISQSGESYEIKEILKNLPKEVRCVGIVNEEKSSLVNNADVALFCKGGREEMTSTKTYVLTALVAYVLGWYLSGNWNEKKVNDIKRLINNFKILLSGYGGDIDTSIAFLSNISTLQIIARGPAFAAASQSALMFKEALKIPATGILGGEFRHGPMEMVSKGFKAILFAAQGKTFTQSIKMARDIVDFGGKVLLITNEKNITPEKNIMPVYINEHDEYLFAIQSIVPIQLFIDSYAKAKGFEAGNFQRGSKITMIE